MFGGNIYQENTESTKNTKDLIIQINNNLFRLAEISGIDIPQLSYIQESEPDLKKNTVEQFNNQVEKAKKIRQESLFAAGIKRESEPKFESPLQDFKEPIMGYGTHKTNSEQNNTSFNKEDFHLVKGNLKGSKIEKGEPVPPKTDWKRVGISNDEKDKILSSIRANPKSNIFSKEFKWNPEDFLSAFKFLEDPEEYNGPFIVSVISDKKELEKYSKIDNLSSKIDKISVGKFILLSVYDITASDNNNKNFYLGLDYISMEGRLKFNCIGSLYANEITKNQKKLSIEYMDSLDIEYDEKDENLF